MANRQIENRPVEPRRGINWVWILLILLLVALLLWWLWPEAAVEEPVDVGVTEVEPIEPITPAPAPAIPVETILVVEIVEAPEAWIGRTVEGQAQVESVPTDRGFWIQADGQRLFAVLDDQGDEVPIHVQSGQTLRISEAEVHGTEDLEEVSGNLDPDTREILQGQEIFLTVKEKDLTIIDTTETGTGGGGNAGTDAGTGGGT